ncbi:hypothetical protein DM02DRAFT_610456 [Periconia macrospinosa]|uniref:GAR domain-containing protein n=1 Tax=Periconia macrospinosa TaxID=97972 RepID=A0A2V1E5J6_9PLEO|nr:hypothetical protein DM02DRAFT_610456 [Periconia macrospinosa]
MLSSPPRLLPPASPFRPPSPSMSPGGRRNRTHGTSDESHLRQLSPETTLRAFTEQPMPFDTTRDEYKIFACIHNLTPAERDLGTRVAKAAQRLKSWAEELAQWAWSGSFQPPTDEFREQRRKSLELRIREHVKDADASQIPVLDYWGSMLSVEVEAHEARLDEISEDLIQLDVEELKEHVLDMHPSSRSRPSSAGLGRTHRAYTPVDDFSFLITQTLLSALPHHFLLKDRLSTWTARVTILREAPRFLEDLNTTQKAMHLGWEALSAPEDHSDAAFTQWKQAVDTVSDVLRTRTGSLGRLLDRWLDALEGRDDCLPDDWIDRFEKLEDEFTKWTHEAHSRAIVFDIRRNTPKETRVDSVSNVRRTSPEHSPAEDDLSVQSTAQNPPSAPETHQDERRVPTAFKGDIPQVSYTAPDDTAEKENAPPDNSDDESVFEEGDTVIHHEMGNEFAEDDQSRLDLDSSVIITTTEGSDSADASRPETPRSRRSSFGSIASDVDMSFSSSPPDVIDESPSANRAARAPRPALNAAMHKRRTNKEPTDEFVESAPWPPTQFSHNQPHTVDDLESKISDILTTIPAHIRLTTGTGADARSSRAARRVTSKGSKGYLRAQRSFSSMKSPELTLSPVKHDFDSANALSGRKSTSALRVDDIKLYHLTQPGKDKPHKLFIRRVGEHGERVMVRVGGGWADLGEYLRSYAEHHGRRTVSSEKFEILGLEMPTLDSPPSRPGSVMSRTDRRLSGTQAGSTHTTPVKPSEPTLSTDEPPPPIPNFTPVQVGIDEALASSAGSSKSWRGDEVGLAGPKARRLDLSEDKLEWVDSMMKQARSVSGSTIPKNGPQQTDRAGGNSRNESRTESRNGLRNASRNGGVKKQPSQEFGTLGKVGGTKRIYMRGGAINE